jgi:hypothetical protein
MTSAPDPTHSFAGCGAPDPVKSSAIYWLRLVTKVQRKLNGDFTPEIVPFRILATMHTAFAIRLSPKATFKTRTHELQQGRLCLQHSPE